MYFSIKLKHQFLEIPFKKKANKFNAFEKDLTLIKKLNNNIL